MNTRGIEARIRWAGILVAFGLVVLLVSLLWTHPLSFMVLLVVGCPPILGGALLFLHVLATATGRREGD